MNRVLLLLACGLLFAGCLTDLPHTPGGIRVGATELLLTRLEAAGDYINSTAAPPAVAAAALFAQLDSFTVLDLRDSASYNRGHIPGALISSAAALTVLLQQPLLAKPVAIVTATGQAAAYYATLLRLAGLNNIFFLEFGMAGWNAELSAVWNDATSAATDYRLTETATPRGTLAPLPVITSTTAGGITLMGRISFLLTNPFPESSKAPAGTLPAAEMNELFDQRDSATYLICYGVHGLYTARAYGIMHPVNSVYYSAPPVPDLHSSAFLQSLPPGKRIIIYSVNGFEAAALCAYLRLLGYNAAALQFGAGSFMQQQLLQHPSLRVYAWYPARAAGYPLSRQ